MKYKNNEIKFEELINVENQTVFTWSGTDIKDYLQNQFKEEEMLKHVVVNKEHINSVIHHLNDWQCGDCVTCVVSEYIDNLKKSTDVINEYIDNLKEPIVETVKNMKLCKHTPECISNSVGIPIEMVNEICQL